MAESAADRLAAACKRYASVLDAYIEQLLADLEEEQRVSRLIAHLRHFTPSAQTPRQPITSGVVRVFIPSQRQAPEGVPAAPRPRRGLRPREE